MPNLKGIRSLTAVQQQIAAFLVVSHMPLTSIQTDLLAHSYPYQESTLAAVKIPDSVLVIHPLVVFLDLNRLNPMVAPT